MSDSSSSSSPQEPAPLASASVAPQQQRQPQLLPQLQSNQSQMSDSSSDSLDANSAPNPNPIRADASEQASARVADSSEKQAINEFKNIAIILRDIDACIQSTRSIDGVRDQIESIDEFSRVVEHTRSVVRQLASDGKIDVQYDKETEDKSQDDELVREFLFGVRAVKSDPEVISSADESLLGELLLRVAMKAFKLSTCLDSLSTSKDSKDEGTDISNPRASCSKDSQPDANRESQDNVKIGAKKLKISSTSAVVRTSSTDSVNNSVNDSSSQDDDSEPILGLLFREHSGPHSDKRSSDPSNMGKDGKKSLDPAIQNSQKLLSTATQTLDFINGCFVSQQDLILSLVINGKLSAKQLDYLNQFIRALEESWKPVEDYFSLARSLSTLANNLFSIKFFESEDDVVKTAKYSSLITLADTILDLILGQTATFNCDNIKLNFTDIFSLLTSLTGFNDCAAHKIILPNAIKWLEACRKHLKMKQVFASMLTVDKTDNHLRKVLDATCCLINYLGSILDILRYITALSANDGSESDAAAQHGQQADWVDDGPCFNMGEDEDDDESMGDDSDDDSSSNKLCTFTLTQKEFVNQHWYHCHTCNMIDRVGVCTVCAKVCHKDHDISYSKYGAFFCDCAGREGGTCFALVRRSPATSDEIKNSLQGMSKQEAQLRDSKPEFKGSNDQSRDRGADSKKVNAYFQRLVNLIEPHKDDLMQQISESGVCQTIMDLLYGLIPTYVQFAQDECYMGRCKRARLALDKFHTSSKTYRMTESLMLPTLGSQEGAFENVRVNFTGEHASLIKQLITNNSLRRVAMTSLASPLGKRQHLVVCHERGKITLLQLNALLRQADSSKRKLTLTRLASAPVPFSVISITANPFNEDVLAVCGLRDCHVLTFTQNGLVSSHIELNIDLTSASDHIVKAVWVPGSQVELAVLTTEVVKIYDLSEEYSAPKHHLKLAFGQVKDVTFIVPEVSKTKYILIMNTAGHIFRQELDGRTLSSHGLFYVTTELRHSHINEKEGRINGGGVSLYFSHLFRTLFFSYTDGNFMASMPKFSEIQQVFPLEFELSRHVPPTSGSQLSYASIAAGSGQATRPDEPSPKHHSLASSVQPLCQWSEIPGHTGMMMAFCQTSNNPVILMLNPDRILAQEIKYLSVKSKITDATAIRHTTSSGEVRTTLILLCEDGSLRIYMASQDLTNTFWLRLSPIHNMPVNFGAFALGNRPMRDRRLLNRTYKKSDNATSQPTFSVDFFENLQQMNDVEFGGKDVLSVYSVQQLKTRLNASGTHVTCPKAAGFSVDVVNNDSNMVTCGIRVQVGAHDLAKSPSSIEVFGRTIPINPLTARWYDIPLTREESLQAEKKFTLSFGPSSDPNNITTIDSIKIYGKTKDSFSWPEEGEDGANATNMSGEDLIGALLGRETGAKFQRLIIHAVECFDCLLNLKKTNGIQQPAVRDLAQELATSLITVPYPAQVSKAIKSLLTSVYSEPGEYNSIRDMTALDFVTNSLAKFEQEDLDFKLFSRVVYIMKSLCQAKLSMFSNLTNRLANVFIEQDSNLKTRLTTDSAKLEFIMLYLHGFFQHLHSQRPINMNLASVHSSGPIDYEETLRPFIELLYIAMLHDLSISNVATTILVGYILNEDLNISICARHTMIRLLRVKGGYQEGKSVPNESELIQESDMVADLPSSIRLEDDRSRPSEAPGVILANEHFDQSIPELGNSLVGSQQSSMASQLRNVLRDQIDRNDNEEDIAIAIALSLQDDNSQNNSVTDNAVTAAPTTSGRSELNFLSDRMPSAEELMSDTTASGVASDEEVSTSGLRSVSLPKPSSNPQMDCAQASSSCNLESTLPPTGQTPAETRASDSKSTTSNDHKANERERVRQLHLALLQKFIERLPETRNAGGYRSISLLHVILVLTLDLDYENQLDNLLFRNLLNALRDELSADSTNPIITRSATNEVKLVIMRMFSIFMSKVRTSSLASTVSSSTRAETNSCWSTYCSSMTATSLIDSEVLEFCFTVLKHLIDYWKDYAEDQRSEASGMSSLVDNIMPINKKTLPKSFTQSPTPDLAPFFLRSHVKGQPTDLFADYTQLLTEMVLRIPYQIKKVSSSSSNNLKPVIFTTDWSTTLCEYLMIQIPSFIKKHVRKLLTNICGSKENYRQLRDFHFLESHMRSIKEICGLMDQTKSDTELENELRSLQLNYEAMSLLVEHLKACIEIAQNRCINWQVYCLLKDQSLLCSLVKISLNFGDDVSPIVLELLQHALSSPQLKSGQNIGSIAGASDISTAVPLDLTSRQAFRDTLTSESLNANLSQQLIGSISKDLLSRFVQSFLLETNATSLRWQAHLLLFNLWSNFTPSQQYEMLLIFWSLWHNLPKYGRKASQFVDLIGFMTIKSPENESGYDKVFCQETLNVLRQQNQLLMNHQNAHIYSSIQGLVDLESYYLESDPCSVCNSPEVGYNNIKLSSIKVDSRFTTTTQIIKLIGSHTILKFTLRISDIKRSKMVKTVGIYYNNRSVQSVVELKNKSGIWSLARKQSLSPSQAEVKIEFTLPIIACNLMIEFSEFYDNFQASSETLQCPRCSTSVSANPGVCSNCGENVFQCHKCRAINYDEKDPFLCISCGFCKYARFDISLTARPTCAVDPIENEEDRKKTVTSISNLMEKADRVYRNLMQNKPTLELLLLRIHEQVLPDKQYDDNYLSLESGSPQSSVGVTGAGIQAPAGSIQQQPMVVSYAPPTGPPTMPSVNKAIQHLAQKYCVECKSLYEELSKITHKVLASRKELVDYDNRQLGRSLSTSSSALSSANRRKSRVYSSLSSCSGRCYGCATATVEHCVKMLKALSTIPKLRGQICESGVINELVNFNLRNGSYLLSQEIRELLCTLTRGDLNSTTTLTDLLMEKIEAISKQDYQPFEISNIVKHELSLLSVTLDSDDNCCELRLRCLIKVFAFALEIKNPTVMECLIIPCLRLLLSIVKPPPTTTRRHKDKNPEAISSIRSDNYRTRVSLQEWLNDSAFVFDIWRKKSARPTSLSQSSKSLKPLGSSLRRTSSKTQHRVNYLIEKYGYRWRSKCIKCEYSNQPINELPNDWLKRLLFNQSSRTVRSMARSLVESFFDVRSRRTEIVELMTGYLDEIGPSGECAQEFFLVYKQIITTDHWRHYLSLKGILIKLCDLITIEIDNLQELEETTLNSSLSSGYALKMLLEILSDFVSVPEIHAHYKSQLVGFILKGYLSLRKLVVQRTKVIDEAQEMLLELLEGMTTGSESETAAFINVCVEAIQNCHDGDIRTPVFIFERLCSTIHPEENANSEFFVSLEKDPQQEDYLQGRMLGNPYSSNDVGIGPLMKDIKNKICQDCELLALLEDDSSMELLVSNKIICLDLPVRDVYKRIWCAENHESEAMRIIYRMRGLLGDATEEFIESLDSRNNEEVDEEQVFKMANIMSSSGGLEVMLNRLKQIDDLSPPFKPLLDVILKLFNQCTKTRDNRLKLISKEFKTPETLLSTLRLALNESDFLDAAGLPKGFDSFTEASATPANKATVSSNPNPRTNVVDQLLNIMGDLLSEASRQPSKTYIEFCAEACGSVEDIQFMLRTAQALSNRLPHVSHKIVQVAPFLTLGIAERMSTLVDYFRSSMDFETFDQDHSALNDSTIDLFCIMVDAIARNDNGNLLKDFIVEEKIVAQSIAYLTTNAPPLKSSLLATSEEWKEFTSRPALKYVLRILGGLSQDHSSTQVLISRDCIPIVHGLEQVSSDAHVGTLAENLLEAIKQHPAVAEKIELVRRQTKEEKKRLAMAVRERQLGALGMKANERGQVIAKSKLLDQCLDLAEDTGLICNICREGYKFQPSKVLGIYTYTKRCVLDEFEMKPRKSYGYTTVTHFNTVHVECHMSAVRSARSRDEWDSAALQNANTRCNGLLPIWGPQVPESSYASALARHNSYLQDSTGYRDIGYHSTTHDIRLQLLRFAQERSFSEDTGGGGPQSNLHLLPYMMQTALYVLNSTKATTREYKRALNYLEMSSTEVIENCYDVDGPYYWCSLALLVLPPIWWKKKRLQFLQRLIVCNHVRRVSIKPPAPISDTRVRAYSYYKSALIFFAFIDSFYNIVFKDAALDDKWNHDWSASLADYLKHNEQTMNDNIEVLLNLYQNSLLPCTSLERFFEIIRIDEVSQPSEFIVRTLESI